MSDNKKIRQLGSQKLDFLAAFPYSQWCKLIKQQMPTKQDGYVKTIDYIGTDGADYRFIFYQLTNDTDVLISQYKKTIDGTSQSIKIDPYKCLKN